MKKLGLISLLATILLPVISFANPLTPGDFGRFDAGSSADATGSLLILQADGVLERVTPALVAAGGSAVIGPSSATDNALARFDSTTGKLIQDSVVIASDLGAITGVTALTTAGLTVNATDGTAITAIRFAFDAVASGQTSKTTTLTGATASSRCVASAAETATNAVYIRSVVPGTNQVVVTTSADPGASNLDYTVVCYN